MALRAEDKIKEDMRQEVTMAKLDALAKKITNYLPTGRASVPQRAKTEAASGGGIFDLFGGSKKPPPKKVEPAMPKPTGPRGLYLWGGTGTGKTFMMDIFYDAVPVERKNRIHFHEWMIDVHERLHRRQKSRATKDASADDIVTQVAEEMLSEAWLLCFDEFQVTHISDAIIMKRIFSVLFERGAVVVATSNRPPDDLYLNGLNRPLFMPFIPMLKEFCEVHDIGAEVDYRIISGEDDEEDSRVYIHPNGEAEKNLLERKFHRLCQGGVRSGVQLETQGRRIVVPKAGVGTDIGFFRFKDLCDRPLGAADYLAVASAFHTIFIADIPTLTLQERDQVRRFITLIDAFYEKHVKLLCTADDHAIGLFRVSEEEKKTMGGVMDEIFAWDRTVSRLTEMASAKYLADVSRRLSSEDFMAQFNLVTLTDEDVKEMWGRYDSDDSGALDMDELRVMLEDLLEKDRGHRNMSQELFDASVATIDTNRDGSVSFDEFAVYLKNYSSVKSSVGDTSYSMPMAAPTL